MLIYCIMFCSQLPKYLLTPNPNTGRYSPFQSRVAAAQLFAFLKKWSSVVLLENQCYVRFLPLSGEPHLLERSKFCIIKIGQKSHRMLLNIGFLEGTNNQWRQEVGYFSKCCITCQVIVSWLRETLRGNTWGILHCFCSVGLVHILLSSHNEVYTTVLILLCGYTEKIAQLYYPYCCVNLD